ncbi:MAG TPA: R3H domain-containing nucleic acid-binding protein [Candidatus Saccharimonadia bacterium]|nr:R3H domain-containing nucleic acid-binding protein [Candidatus Saccharimonadia bacterium]
MSEALQAEARRRLEELVSFFGVNAEAEVRQTEEGIELDLASTPATPRLIGHRGETLRAIEFLVNQMIKHTDGDAPRVLVDVAGYKKARRASLEEMAREVAQRVVETGREEELKPMNPAERRIVHMALREIPEVATESRGEDRSRRIVVLPAA